jgi:heptosyltransferase-2
MKTGAPLIVRLRNYVGDVVLALPTLQRLEGAGYALQFVGRRWAGSLLEGAGWTVAPYAGKTGERVRQLRALRRAARAVDPGFDRRLNAIVFPWSFSSALEMRLAGLRSIGHAHEGRRWLLSRSVDRVTGGHEMAVYWQLGEALLGGRAAPPAFPRLPLSPAQHAQARQALQAHGVGPGPIVICPFASNAQGLRERVWPGFAPFVAGQLPALGRPIVVVPGPGEEAMAAQRYPSAIRLEGLPLGTYAAVLASAALMVSGDTGPGHVAGAVGTPTLSILGPTDPVRWRVLGPRVQVVQSAGGWPDPDQVLAAAAALLGPARAAS